MALIEGVGDEVLQFFVVLLLLFLAVLAWWSTKITDRPLLRTVVILERRSARETESEAPRSPTAPPLQQDDKATEGTAIETASSREVETSSTTEEAAVTNVSSPFQEHGDVTNASSEPGDVSGLRNRRLAFFEHGDTIRLSAEASIRQQQREVIQERLMEDLSEPLFDIAAPEEVAHQEEPVVEEENLSQPPEEKPKSPDQSIRIRLKYLNDELKLVDGNLEEQLGEFKKRHFNLELSSRKLVRLIFKGRVLQQESWTLGHYGLYDNCVVHCLVHQSRTPPPSPNLNVRPGVQRAAALSPWALSNILLASLSLLLGLAWYGRYQYAQLYTATTTVALVGLTGFFTVSLIGLYMPDLQ